MRTGDSELMLPQAARTSLEYNSGDVSESVVEFTHCRQFRSSWTISFGKPEDVSASPAKRGEAIDLPGGLTVVTRLENGIDLRDLARATRSAHAWSVMSFRSARHGCPRVQRYMAGSGGSRSSRIRANRCSWVSSLPSLPSLPARRDMASSSRIFNLRMLEPVSRTGYRSTRFQTEFLSLLSGGMLETTSIEEFSNVELPGVAVLALPGKTRELPAGTQLVWRTRRLGLASHPAIRR
jgi:hypothetical protein